MRTFKTYSLIQPEDSFDAVFLVSKVGLYYTLIIMKYSTESARTWKPFLKLLFALSERSLNLTESHYKMGMIDQEVSERKTTEEMYPNSRLTKE